MSLTYLCRTPLDTSLNEKVAAFASQDYLGRACTADRDCGYYRCAPSKDSAGAKMCTDADGNIPFAREGDACNRKPSRGRSPASTRPAIPSAPTSSAGGSRRDAPARNAGEELGRWGWRCRSRNSAFA
jgi:hypothetical protein